MLVHKSVGLLKLIKWSCYNTIAMMLSIFKYVLVSCLVGLIYVNNEFTYSDKISILKSKSTAFPVKEGIDVLSEQTSINYNTPKYADIHSKWSLGVVYPSMNINSKNKNTKFIHFLNDSNKNIVCPDLNLKLIPSGTFDSNKSNEKTFIHPQIQMIFNHYNSCYQCVVNALLVHAMHSNHGICNCTVGAVNNQKKYKCGLNQSNITSINMPIKNNYNSKQYNSKKTKKDIKQISKREIIQIVEKASRDYNIPTELLMAIGKVESKLNPCAINYNGKSSYYKTIQKTVTAASAIRNKSTNFGVGCYQLHYLSHKRNFKSLEDMIDPTNNIRYAARFFARLYRENGYNWKNAIKKYHSKNETLGKRYLAKVLKHVPGNLIKTV